MMENNSERLRDIEKMAVLGNLLAGIGHELRTPLSAIISNNDSFERSCKRVTDILAKAVEKLDSDSRNELKEILENIENINESNKAATQHMLAVLNSLRNFSRGDDVKMIRTDVNECLKTTLTIAGHELKGRIEVEADYGHIPMIMGHPNQLTQVFMNIIINSAQAIAGNGKISIKTGKVDDGVVVIIADNGNGIETENIAKIFEFGFTTKERGIGTGLGLAIVKKIVDEHNGKIDVESETGKGTQFSIFLPIKKVK